MCTNTTRRPQLFDQGSGRGPSVHYAEVAVKAVHMADAVMDIAVITNATTTEVSKLRKREKSACTPNLSVSIVG